MIDKKTIDIIKSTVPVLKEHGVDLTTLFYKTMFANNPEVQHLFNMDNQKSLKQPKALATAILAVAENIDNLDSILPAVEVICKKHVFVNVLPEHYPIVGENLLKAMKELLNVDDEILEAWGKVYGVISEVFIGEEKKLYSKM